VCSVHGKGDAVCFFFGGGGRRDRPAYFQALRQIKFVFWKLLNIKRMTNKNPASPQPTSDCQSPGGLPPGIALGCWLTSVRGNRGENYEK
jgi:hypothetical protein